MFFGLLAPNRPRPLPPIRAKLWPGGDVLDQLGTALGLPWLAVFSVRTDRRGTRQAVPASILERIRSMEDINAR